MTIIEAIREVLSSEMVGMTSREIYDEIISKNLYIFPAANPPAVVNNIIRRHCLDLNFPTANAVKHFKIVGYRGKKTLYALIDSSIEKTDEKTSGVVVGGSHDGGIDGIIYEDKLGLDKIYLQAKRYGKRNTVGRKDLQAFVGAMESVQKGVFITTSSFTKEALAYAESQQQKSLKLIDGEKLSDLMVQYEIGIQKTARPIYLYRLDVSYLG